MPRNCSSSFSPKKDALHSSDLSPRRYFAQTYGVVLGEVALVEAAGSPKSRRIFLGEVLKAGPNVARFSGGLNRARRRLNTSPFELECTDYEQQRKFGCLQTEQGVSIEGIRVCIRK